MRRIVIWTGPIMAMALLVIGGFLYWVLATTPGIRWALVTAVMQVDGSVSGVSGSVWKGLQIGQLSLSTEQFDVDVTDFRLDVQWPRLLDRQLHVQQLSADRLHLALATAAEPDEESAPFTMPDLPVQIRIDRLALGELSLWLNHEPIPVDVGNLASSVSLGDGGGQLRLHSLGVSNKQIDTQLSGDFRLLQWHEPWSFDGMLQATAQGRGSESVLCAQHYLPTLPGSVEQEQADAAHDNDNVIAGEAGNTPACSLSIHANARGDMHDMVVSVNGSGQGMALDAMANLTPFAVFPLKDAHVDLTLADESSLHAQLVWHSQNEDRYDHVSGTLQTNRLNLGQLVGESLPSAVLTASGRFDAYVQDFSQLLSSSIELDVAEGSVWNDEALEGVVRASLNTAGSAPLQNSVPVPESTETTTSTVSSSSAEGVALDWRTVQLHDVDVDLRLGRNHIQLSGAFGRSGNELVAQVSAPVLAAFWPGLPGGIDLEADLKGAVSEHVVMLNTTYTPDDSEPEVVGSAPAQLQIELAGGWRAIAHGGQAESGENGQTEGWEGHVRRLQASHAGLGMLLSGEPALQLAPASTSADGLWKLGRATLELSLDGSRVLQVAHSASSAGIAGQWATAGQVEQLVISQQLIDDIQQIVSRVPGAPEPRADAKRGGVKVRGANHESFEITLALDWDLQFDQALGGTLQARHVAGDILVPSDPPFSLGLQTLSLDVLARPDGNTGSRLTANLAVETAQMGRADVVLGAYLNSAAGSGFSLAPDRTTVAINAAIEDLGWVSLFTGDAMEFAGKVNVDVTLASQTDGRWDSNGTITGADLRVVRIDDGVRLLDGTLSARLENDRLILDELTFPARLRVEPKEWRTAEWISTNPDARDGYLRVSGQWVLSEMMGDVDIELHRYPVLQRSDRYAMVTGALNISAALPALSITGRVEADAGWIDLDIVGGIPTVDGDVVVIRAGQSIDDEVNVPMDLSMDIEVDLGPRVYLTGYGVNSGLVGNMRVMMHDNRLTAVGALRTRGGAIEAYGQRLQLRRGTITFQGDIASPILDIEALRTGQPVEAGVRVSGTARRPAIDLVSYPDVSDIEKLSWLLFGHGPDESGGDMALLLSVGTSFLGDGEPFYRKFGIDELSLQSGELGSAGSVLPAESVVSGLNTGTSDLERQFISASKGITNGLTVSVRQALSDTGTVGRVSYRLARGLTAELSVGTVNGLALVYRWFSRD